MILRGSIQQIENATAVIRSLDALHSIMFPEHHLELLSAFSPGDRVLVYLPKASLGSEAIEYDEDSRMFRDTFKYISDLRTDKYSDIIVLCNNFKPPMQTRGTDFVFSLGLEDHSGSVELKSFIKEPDFKKFVAPGCCEDTAFVPGDILLLRNVKRGKFDNIAIIYKTCEITNIGAGHENEEYEGLVAEFLRSHAAKRKLLCRKTKKIEQIKDRSFFNILGKVLYCDFDAVSTVCITDFTTNSIAEPNSGRHLSSTSLTVKMFGRHAELCNRIHLNKHYLFMNIRIHSFSPNLEAYMHDSLEGDVIPIEDQELLEELSSAEKSSVLMEKDAAIQPGDAGKLQSPFGLAKGSMECSTDTSGRNECQASFCHLPCKERLSIAKLGQIKVPGIFLCSCFVKNVEFLETEEGMISKITVKEHCVYTLDAKQKLTAKLLKEKDGLENRKHRCLVLKTGGGKLFMVDLFVSEDEYKSFESFYLNS